MIRMKGLVGISSARYQEDGGGFVEMNMLEMLHLRTGEEHMQ